MDDSHSENLAFQEPTTASTPPRNQKLQTPRAVEVSVEGQEALVPTGLWVEGSHIDVPLERVACNVTVKTGLTGRNGMHVVLRVGLQVTSGGLQLPLTPTSLGAWAFVDVAGIEECDIGRLPARTGSPLIPEPGSCKHLWKDPAKSAGRKSPNADSEITVEEALSLGSTACSAEFRCQLVLQVHASCVLKDTGHAALRVEVEGQLGVFPWFKPIGKAFFSSLYKAARDSYQASDYAKAFEKCEEALNVADGLNPRPVEIGDALQLLGALHLQNKSPRLAVKCLERALAIRTSQALREVGRKSQAENAVTATLITLGNAQSELGAHAEALRCYDLAVLRLQRCSGDQPTLANALISLGKTNGALGNHERARSCYQQCLELREQFLGAEHVQLVSVLHNLGLTLQQLTLHREAVRIYQRALSIELKALGCTHLATATTLSNLGSAHVQLGEHQCAANCLSRALEVLEASSGRDHPSVAATWHNLGNSFATAGRGHDAARCLWRALALWSQSVGPAHPDVAATLHSLGNVYRGLLEPASAAKCFEGALRIREVVLGPTHPETARTRHCAALVGCSLGNRPAALQELQTAVNSLLNTLGAEHPWSLQAKVDAGSLRAALQTSSD